MPRKKKVEEPVVETTPVEKKKPGRPKKSDAAVAAEIEVKKTVRRAGRKAKEAAENVIAETEKATKKAKLEVIIQSPMGGAISTDEIAKKIPKGSQAVYVRVDENKLYWVKGDDTGSVEIWE